MVSNTNKDIITVIIIILDIITIMAALVAIVSSFVVVYFFIGYFYFQTSDLHTYLLCIQVTASMYTYS